MCSSDWIEVCEDLPQNFVLQLCWQNGVCRPRSDCFWRSISCVNNIYHGTKITIKNIVSYYFIWHVWCIWQPNLFLFQWDLVCSQAYLTSLATTIYFCGVMVGGLVFGHLADKFGRKPVMLVCLFLPVFVGLGTSFATSYWMFVSLRFIQGILMQVPIVFDLQSALLILKSKGLSEILWDIWSYTY